MNPFTHQLEAGDEIAMPGAPSKTYRVQYVNYTRAYCLPTYRVPVNVGGQVVDGEVTGPGINLAPDAHVTVIRDIRKHNGHNGTVNGTYTQTQTSKTPKEQTTMTTANTQTSTPTNTPTNDASLTARRRKAMNDAITGASNEARKLGTRKAKEDQEQVAPAVTPAAPARKSSQASTTTSSAPSPAPKPRLGCPRGADIDKVGLDCSGSGIEVPPHRYFSPGLDARFKGWMLKIERGVMGLKELPAVVRESYEWAPVLGVGEDGQPTEEVQGYVALQNYKGEDNPRYIELLAEGRVVVGGQEATDEATVKAPVKAPKAKAIEVKAEGQGRGQGRGRGRGRKAKDEAKAETLTVQ